MSIRYSKKINNISIIISGLLLSISTVSASTSIVLSGNQIEELITPINISNSNNSTVVGANISSISDNAKFINQSSIITIASATQDAMAFGISSNLMKNASSIENEGTIFSNANGDEWVYAKGVQVLNQDYDWDINRIIVPMKDTSSITNRGTIEVYSKGIYEIEASGISATLEGNAKIENKGTINTTAELLDANSSEGDSFANAFGLEVSFMKDTSEIINSGTIFANVKQPILNKYNLAIGILNGSDEYVGARADGIIINSGTIKATINDKLDSNGLSIWTYKNPPSNVEIQNEENGKLYGNIVLAGDATLNNKGLISLPYNANKESYTENEYEGRISFQAYIPNFTNSGTIEIGAFKNSNGNIENSQILAKNAKFESGSKMQVNVVAGSKPFIMGDTLSEVAKATEKLEGSENIQMNQTKLVDNSAILDFELIYDEAKKQIDLIVAKVNNLIDIGSQNGRNYSYNAIQIDEIARKPKNENVLAELQTVSLENYEKALESLVPTTQLSAINASNQITSNISNIIFSRLSESPNGLNSGDEMIISENNKAWIKTFGSIGKQKNKNDVYGFDLNSYGLGLGYDKEYKENQFLGLSAFYTKAETKSNFINHQNDIDAYSVVAYGSNLLKDNKTTIYYQTSYTLQKNDSTRELFTNEKANSKFTSKAFAADLKVGHKLGLNDKVSLEPKVGLEYTHYNSPTITESGSKNVNLKTNSFSSSKLVGIIGAELEYKINANSKLITSVKTGYDFKNDKNKRVSSSFVNNPSVIFNSEGINNGRVNYEVGVAYDLSINKRNNLNIAYKYVAEGSKFNNNILMVNYDHKF